MIMDDIKAGMQQFMLDTGKIPYVCYLGRNEVKMLGDWAVENGYLADVDNIEGKSRPEVMGMLVYAVNTDLEYIQFGF